MSDIQQLKRTRAYVLWEQAGRPADGGDEFWLQAENEVGNEIYEKNTKIYRRDGTANTKEALGFIKDWVTSLIQIETAAIGAIGVFVSFKEFPRLSLRIYEWPFLALAVLSFLFSIICSVTLLNALPGAAQRVPADPIARRSDVFSIANEPGDPTLHSYSRSVRVSFLLGMIFFVCFVGARLLVPGEAPSAAQTPFG